MSSLTAYTALWMAGTRFGRFRFASVRQQLHEDHCCSTPQVQSEWLGAPYRQESGPLARQRQSR